MAKRLTVISNLCIAMMLVGLSVAIFTADLTGIFISVNAPVSAGNRHRGEISIMFVVEDDARFLTEILDMLEEREIPATFFVGGNWAGNIRNLDYVKRIAENFTIGNHGFSNKSLAPMREVDQQTEIANAHNLIREITGKQMNLFLPPNGSFNNRTLRSAERLGYRTVMWSRPATQGIIFDKAVYGVQSGDFIKFRPSLATFSSLNNIFREYANRNLQIICLTKNF